MKRFYIVSLLFIALLSSHISSAQQDFEAAFSLGYNINSAVTRDHVNGNRGGLRATLSGGIFIGQSLSAGVIYEQDKWGYSTSTGNIDLALPARSFGGYICKHYQLPNLMRSHERYSEFCIKANLGYTNISKGSPYVQPTAALGYSNNYKGNGFNMGLQLEYTHPFRKMLSGFFSIGTARAFMGGKNTRTYKSNGYEFVEHINYNIQYYTSAIGVRVNF
jgi:hypothetical protein